MDPSIPSDISSWFASTAALAAVVAALVAFVRKHVLALDGWVVILASVLGGAALGLAGQLIGWLTVAPYAAWPTPLGGLAFGGIAGLLASGAVDFLKGILSSGKAWEG